MNSHVAFIGLGVMGAPMAGHLLSRTARSVVVFNRTRSRSEAWVAAHRQCGDRARLAATPGEAARDADVVITCVGDDPDLREVLLGNDGAMSAAREGTVFIDHTTSSATIAREMAQIATDRHCRFLDAPVSGGQAGAEKGTLTIMVGGDHEAFRDCESLMASYSRAVTWMGGSGNGQLTKMVNQICIAGTLQGLAEGLYLGEKAGLDLAKVLDVISKGAAQSWQMENRGKTMIADQFDFGFAVDWMRKDLRICQEEAAHQGAPLEATRMISGFYDEISRLGGGRWDTSSLIRRLRKR